MELEASAPSGGGLFCSGGDPEPSPVGYRHRQSGCWAVRPPIIELRQTAPTPLRATSAGSGGRQWVDRRKNALLSPSIPEVQSRLGRSSYPRGSSTRPRSFRRQDATTFHLVRVGCGGSAPMTGPARCGGVNVDRPRTPTSGGPVGIRVVRELPPRTCSRRTPL